MCLPEARGDDLEETAMLAPELVKHHAPQDLPPLPGAVPETERDFYESYAWCLNPHLTVAKAAGHLRGEIGKLPATVPGWQADETVTNIYLLACGLLNCVDEHLRGPGLRLPWKLANTLPGRAARWLADNVRDNLPPRRPSALRDWRERWLAALHDFLAVAVSDYAADPRSFAAAADELARLLETPLAPDLQAERVGIPSPFRRLDMTHHDVLTLGQRYVARFPDRAEAILLVGLRTSGCYFTPLLRAFFAAQGYGNVSLLTLSPSKGAGRRERRELKRHAARGFTAVIVDDPPHTGGTIMSALEIARRAGFKPGKLRALIPAHPARPHWYKPLPEDIVVSLDPADWHKRRLLDPQIAQARLADYFTARDYARCSVIDSERAEALNAGLQDRVGDERGARLKRIFEVELETRQGQRETRFVLAKSVGWGWLGYHAFLAGHRLAGFVPPVLGLRDGILYMEWVADGAPDADSRAARIDTAARYIAARVRRLSLAPESAAGLDPPRQGNGARLLREQLGKAYGPFPINLLMQAKLARLLRRQPCPFPTFIDGNMQRGDWIDAPGGPLKADYEHHGLGKEELNVIDPAYDLADTILHFELSAEEESRLLRHYVEETGDTSVEQRLMLNKLLAGLWTMKRAHDQLLSKAAVAKRQQALHRQFLSAWDFLTVQAARHCGRQRASATPRWRAPLIALDIDGVIDRRLFGFPTTTPAGVEALALLNAHAAVALDTARSVAEVKAYCEAYALAGGVAEHGSYIWDAVNKRGRVLIGAEAASQLAELKAELERMPGVFLDDRHQYSIRAFTYQDKPRSMTARLIKYLRSSSVGDGAVAPLPTLLIQHLIADLGLDRLCFHHTLIDTTVTAKETGKGSGLTALRDWVLGADAETVAVGDQEPDLWMFRAATRSFAPANIGPAREARLLGCKIAQRRFQNGLLEIARELTKAQGRQSGKPAANGDLVMNALAAADRSRAANLARALASRIVP
jgi:hydroxymethylpyrimidine pyrophosphatase-like HAD family hydrolase